MSTDKMMEEEITKEKPPVREQELRIRQMTFRISEFLYEETKKEADNITEFHKKEKRLFVMGTNVNANVNDIMSLINVIRNLDDEGVAIVSSAIAASMQTRKSTRKNVLSLVK